MTRPAPTAVLALLAACSSPAERDTPADAGRELADVGPDCGQYVSREPCEAAGCYVWTDVEGDETCEPHRCAAWEAGANCGEGTAGVVCQGVLPPTDAGCSLLEDYGTSASWCCSS